MAVIDAGAFVVPRAGADPRCQSFGGHKCGGRRADFRDDLLRGIDTKARHRREPLDSLLMLPKEQGKLRIELSNVRVDHFQFVERHREEAPIERM